MGFMVSTSSTTTTISTASICYTTKAAAFVACTGKKKRMIAEESVVQPSKSSLETSQSDGETGGDNVREGRFFLHWITTTSISTSTTYTSTFSVTKAVCTPPGAKEC